MKMYLISDNIDTLTGMRLAGIPGVVAHGKDELEAALTAAFADPDHRMPLIIDIPDRHGSGRRPDFITAYVNEAIGLKL